MGMLIRLRVDNKCISGPLKEGRGDTEGKRGQGDRERLTETGKRGETPTEEAETRDDYELVDKEVINVLEGSRNDGAYRGAMKEKMRIGVLLILNFELKVITTLIC